MEWLDKLMGAAHAIQQEGTLWLLIYFLLVYRRLPLHRGIIKDARQLDDVTIIASVLFPDNWRRPAPAGTVFPLIFACPSTVNYSIRLQGSNEWNMCLLSSFIWLIFYWHFYNGFSLNCNEWKWYLNVVLFQFGQDAGLEPLQFATGQRISFGDNRHQVDFLVQFPHGCHVQHPQPATPHQVVHKDFC